MKLKILNILLIILGSLSQQAAAQSGNQAPGTLASWGQHVIPSAALGMQFTKVSGFAFHNLALKSDGTVFEWRNNAIVMSVPPGLSGVVAVAAGEAHGLALNSDGTVVAWGDNTYGRAVVPVALSGVISIAAGDHHSLALKQDGTVVAWGGHPAYGEGIVPPGLTDVVAISSGYSFNLALKRNGTVVAWGHNAYGQSTVPAGLNNVVAVAAGGGHSLALKQDGTVVVWGDNSFGQLNIPTNLNSVVAIATSDSHNLALKSDGKVVAWGVGQIVGASPHHGQSIVPPNLSNVVAIATGAYYSLAIVAQTNRSPTIFQHPINRSSLIGSNVAFSVLAYGTAPLNYQWRKNGVNIPGATGAVLTLPSVSAADSGGYSVRVQNSAGSVLSATAHLAVLTDGANATPPTRITIPPTSRPTGKNNLIVVTHGLQLSGNFPEWAKMMTNMIGDFLVARGLNNWQVDGYDWASSARNFTTVKSEAQIIGSRYGMQLATQNWEHVHFIAHSAGSALIEGAAHEIRMNSLSAPTVIHSTFLDPYVGLNSEGRRRYGTNADWADNYFANDDNIIPPPLTEGSLSNAHNVDVTWLDTNKDLYPIYCPAPAPVIVYVCASNAVSDHSYPHDFYTNTISPNVQPNAEGYGFALSKEGGGWNNRGSFPRGNTPHVLGGSHNLPQTIAPLRTQSPFMLNSLPNATSPSGVNIFGSGFSLSSSPAPSPLMAKAGVVAEPAWFAVGVEVTNAANFVRFDARFLSTNADGLLTVYWNTNEIGFVDEGVTANGFETHTFALPSAVTTGLYTLSFRLDSFNGTASSITVTNVTTGFVGVEQPFTLTVVGSTNRIPTLKLTGAAGFNYLLQRSTNLVDWTPSALLLNTNGTVLFTDFSATNSVQRFYRALLP